MYINVPCTKMVHRTIVVTHIYNYINAYTYISILAFDHASKTIYNTYIYNFFKVSSAVHMLCELLESMHRT